MTAAVADRAAHRREGKLLGAQVAANTRIFAGTVVVCNAGGFAVPGSAALGLVVLGVAEDCADNRSGGNGGCVVSIRRRSAIKLLNFPGDPVTQVHMGKPAYLVDDQTVAATNGGGLGVRSVVGVVDGVDPDGVWIYFS